MTVTFSHSMVNGQERYFFTYPDRESLLSDGWDFQARTATGSPRNTEQSTGAVISYDQQLHPGVIRVPVDEGDLWEGINNTRNTLFRDLPADWTSIRLKIASFNPTLGNQQATLTAYQDDDSYVQLSRTCEGFNQIMFTSEEGGHAVNLVSVPEQATTGIYLRLDREAQTQVITSFYSLDGELWIKVGTIARALGNARFSIETGASPGGLPDADFEWAEISSQPLPPVRDSLLAFPNSLVFSAIEGKESEQLKTVFLSALESSILGWECTTNAEWLSPQESSGVTPSDLRVGVVTTGMKAGSYQSELTLEAPLAVSGQVHIPVTLIIRPDIPVEAAPWKDDRAGAMSVSVDDGQPSAFNELFNNGFRGTYVTTGSSAPLFYSSYYQAGMEVGSHLVNHPCSPVTGTALRDREILPNISGLTRDVPAPLNRIISLIWPCGFTNYMEQAVASEYFLSARGYNINRLEEQTPDNFMNLKSYNSHEHTPFPPSDLKTLVDSAILRKKWFNLVLHNYTNDDGAIAYSVKKDIWVAPVGTVIKYILQRDRLLFDAYSETPGGIGFSVSRLPLTAGKVRNFEEAFISSDEVTLRVDIADNRIVDKVETGGVRIPYQTKVVEGNRILLLNIKPEPGLFKQVEIIYRDKPALMLSLNMDTIGYNTLFNRNPQDRILTLLSDVSEPVGWSSAITDGIANWDLRLSPSSGFLNDSISFSVDCKGLPPGDYTKKVTIYSPSDEFYPVDIDIFLHVRSLIMKQNYPNPFSSATSIEFDLPEDGPVTLEIFNSTGDKCVTLLDENMLSGNRRLKWEPRGYMSGIYFLVLKTRHYREVIRMSYIK